jgi:DNA-binding response OmpR family regulator
MTNCPCCGEPWKPGKSKMDAKRLGLGLTLAPQAFKIIDYLIDHFGECVHTDRLVSLLYHDRDDGGPITAANVVATRLTYLRDMVEPYGLEIEGKSWRGTRVKWRDEVTEEAT